MIFPSSISAGHRPQSDTDELLAWRGARWRPGLGGTCHSEIFASVGEGAGAGATLALALDDLRHGSRNESAEIEDGRSVLWVQTREAARLNGRPYRPGLPEKIRHRVIHVLADKAKDALFALEEGVRCRDVAFVVGELVGNSQAMDFTASRRLTLAAERHGVSLYLIRFDAQRDLSSARMRWQVSSAPSLPSRWEARSPGTLAWNAELFRARGHAVGEWVLTEEDRTLAASRPFESTAMGDARPSALSAVH